MKCKFWKKKTEVPTVIQHKMHIDIYFYGNNKTISFNCSCEGNSDYKDIFKDFYCWYKLGKTEDYEFKYIDGAYLFKRSDIRMIHFYTTTY